MTHTLHRVGDKESLEGDYLIYMVPARRINAKGSTPKLKKFLDICAKYNPVDIGCLYPNSESALPKGYLKGHSFQELKESVVDRTEIIVIYSDKEKVKKILQELRGADLGISVVVSGIFDVVFECCREAGLTPHTVNMALGILGKTELIPPRKILDVVTMCGHGLISEYLVEDCVKQVREGKMTAEEAAKKLGVNCVCGAFNPARAAELIEEIVESS